MDNSTNDLTESFQRVRQTSNNHPRETSYFPPNGINIFDRTQYASHSSLGESIDDISINQSTQSLGVEGVPHDYDDIPNVGIEEDDIDRGNVDINKAFEAKLNGIDEENQFSFTQNEPIEVLTPVKLDKSIKKYNPSKHVLNTNATEVSLAAQDFVRLQPGLSTGDIDEQMDINRLSFYGNPENQKSQEITQRGKKNKKNNDNIKRNTAIDNSFYCVDLDSKRNVYILNDKDLNMFNSIVSFKKREESPTINAAMHKYCKYGGDALVKVVYDDESTHWDAVLRYHRSQGKNGKIRAAFVKALLAEGLVIQEDRNRLGKHFHLKIITPFPRLCLEAERMKLMMPLQRITMKNMPDVKLTGVMNDNGRTEAGNGLPWEQIKAQNDANNTNKSFFGSLTSQGYNSDEVWSGLVETFTGDSKKPAAPFKIAKIDEFIGGNLDVFDAADVQSKFFTNAQRNLLTYNIVQRTRIKTLSKNYKAKDLHCLLNDNVFSEFFPLHDGPYKEEKNITLRSKMYKVSKKWLKRVNIDDIRCYFGERIALYFSFVDFFTLWLLFAAVVGLGVFAYGIYNAANNNAFASDILTNTQTAKEAITFIFDNRATLPFALFISIWATLFLHFWKRRNIRLAWWWDVLHYEKEERTRPQWYGTEIKTSKITGLQEIYFPKKYKYILKSLSLTVILVMFLILVASVAAYVIANAAIRDIFREKHPTKMVYASAASGAISLGIILFLDPLCTWIALKLTDFENHKTDTMYIDSLIAKRMLFGFVNNFGTLIYIAVIKVWVQNRQISIAGKASWTDSCTYDNCMVDLMIQMAITFMGLAFLQHLRNLLLPLYDKFLNIRKRNSDIKIRREQHEGSGSENNGNEDISDGDKVKEYDETQDDWFDDFKLAEFYKKGFFKAYFLTIVQFSFIIMFSISFPLAPFFAVLHNHLRRRIDLHNVLTQFKRPFAIQAQDIGMWENWAKAITYFAVLLNACTIAFSSVYFEENYLHFFGTDSSAEWASRLFFILAYEHVILFVKLLAHYFIPETPEDVKVAIAKERYEKRYGYNKPANVPIDTDILRKFHIF